ncbi:MAG: aminoacyl-tRNA hydrolase [Bacteroidales bacterium]|nr:aminoacyl-tRNA hydrolase [Bacteroidales bacterium]
MKYLIAGLGNMGDEYHNTRHNIGFRILDTLADAFNITFMDKRYGFVSEYNHKGRKFLLLKPNTYVNLSGRSVNYWLQKASIPLENLLVIIDDIALPFGTLRLRPCGGDGGHNGLINISQTLGHQQYARLRFGIGNDYPEGFQVDYVLGTWSEEEEKKLPERIAVCHDIIRSFGLAGLEKTMNEFNNR